MRKHLAYLLLAAGAGGAALLWLGWFNIGASTGHWAVSDWLLHTAMRRSVKFHASAEPPADLTHPARIRTGAGHYEMGCAFCHGSPARPRGAVPRAMTPVPPDLAEKIPHWSSADLHWIVQHGVKFTGMPAWPTQKRADEAWSVTAFLLAYPHMDAVEYLRLAYGEIDPGSPPPDVDATLADCARCHGLDGRGDPNGAFPRLDILSEEAIRAALAAYSRAERASGIMQTATRRLEDSTLDTLAAHYAAAEAGPPALDAAEVDADLLARGQAIAAHGLPDQDVAACSGCHSGEGADLALDAFPNLDGQYGRYLRAQLELYAGEAERGGGRFADLMTMAAHTLEPPDIEAVVAWYASRAPDN